MKEAVGYTSEQLDVQIQAANINLGVRGMASKPKNEFEN